MSQFNQPMANRQGVRIPEAAKAIVRELYATEPVEIVAKQANLTVPQVCRLARNLNLPMKKPHKHTAENIRKGRPVADRPLVDHRPLLEAFSRMTVIKPDPIEE